MRVSYNKNVGLALDTDLTLLLDAELTGFSDLRLNGNVELIGWRLKLKRDATHAHV